MTKNYIGSIEFTYEKIKRYPHIVGNEGRESFEVVNGYAGDNFMNLWTNEATENLHESDIEELHDDLSIFVLLQDGELETNHLDKNGVYSFVIDASENDFIYKYTFKVVG